MYAESVKLRAYTLFLSPGESPEEIARILKTDYPKITAKTIRKWAETPGHAGLTWADNKNIIQIEVRNSANIQATSQRTRLKGRMETVMDKLYKDILDKQVSPNFKTLEGAAHAIKSVAGFLIQLEDQEQERWSGVMAAQMVLDIFNDIPEVRKIIEKHWDKIWLSIQERLDSTSNTKEISAEVVQ